MSPPSRSAKSARRRARQSGQNARGQRWSGARSAGVGSSHWSRSRGERRDPFLSPSVVRGWRRRRRWNWTVRRLGEGRAGRFSPLVSPMSTMIEAASRGGAAAGATEWSVCLGPEAVHTAAVLHFGPAAVVSSHVFGRGRKVICGTVTLAADSRTLRLLESALFVVVVAQHKARRRYTHTQHTGTQRRVGEVAGRARKVGRCTRSKASRLLAQP